MFRRQEELDRTLFVGNLDCNVNEEILYELFLQAGPLTKATIAKDKEGNSKAFGFIRFKHSESVPYAKALLNGIRLYGRAIKVHYQFGSSFSSEETNAPQSSANGFTPYPQDYGMSGPEDRSAALSTTNFVDNNYFHQTFMYFQGMINQCLSYGWMGQQPSCSTLAFPWHNDNPFPWPNESGSDGVPGPSSMDCNANSYRAYQNCEHPNKKRKKQTHDSTSNSSDLNQHEQSHKPRKRKKKKRKT
ncbi:RNA binding motif protein 11 S homeolog isoform X1 [Xenopus laevis]|uniref:RNA binding motif protein 11 S homeolog isoform X1 n=2 Tax=Xenopus laevis TaxID=8355 RepID=A0A1L8H514_XENLA|nr:RNA binding motif protein 11 S homeolog isoform X1 [Xenopus laevis]XP_018103774.1 RNA binding motif protein 11 S homeolog isoform X1 [Xenopus laevis]XP_041439072.1 RNA binding motif protein 11 S homeolog isoform X1 [Xenopus laevis]OCT91180.1 hypothetical protein XELAEV_18014236mg [Xenopus laevis]